MRTHGVVRLPESHAPAFPGFSTGLRANFCHSVGVVQRATQLRRSDTSAGIGTGDDRYVPVCRWMRFESLSKTIPPRSSLTEVPEKIPRPNSCSDGENSTRTTPAF